MELSVAGGGQAQDGYSYLCRLEELRQWMTKLLGEDVPKLSELEARLRNGVLLVKLGMKLLPGDPMWRKAYDLEEKKYLASGVPDFRHTDNINFWLQSLATMGLPAVFYPQTTDIFEAKNIPKLVFCLHALSHYSARQGKVASAVPNLEGRAQFSEKEITDAADKVACANVPSFGAVEDLVDEEMQYQAMGEFVSPEQLDELRQEHKASREQMIENENIYDPVAADSAPVVVDAPPVPRRQSMSIQKVAAPALPPDIDLYDTSDNVKNQLQHKADEDDDEAAPPVPPKSDAPLAEVQCGEGIKASLYSSVDKAALEKARQEAGTPQEKAMAAINKAVTSGDGAELLRALRNPDADLPDIFSEPTEYLQELLAESKSTFPVNVTPVFTGISREKAEELLSSLSPGAILVRAGSQGERVVSFRNRTGIKHWKVGVSSDGMYFFGASPRFSNIGDFMQEFITSLSSSTGLHAYFANDQLLKPSAVDQDRIYGLGPENPPIQLEREYIERVVAQVNKRIRQKLLSLMGGADGDAQAPEDAAAGIGAVAAGPAPPPPRTQRPSLERQGTQERRLQRQVSLTGPQPPQPPGKAPQATATAVAAATVTAVAAATVPAVAWSEALLSRMNRDQAEKVLTDHGEPGKFVVRVSERGAGQYSITFRLRSTMKHWRVVEQNGTFSIPPNSPKVDSLTGLIAIFQKVEHEPGLAMSPLLPPGNASAKPVAAPAPSINPSPANPIQRQGTLSGGAPTPPDRNIPSGAGVVSLAPSLHRAGSGSGAGEPVSEWTVEHVQRWLTGVGLGMHTTIFMENYVDGECLLEITDAQLKNDMAITALGHRTQILRKIKTLM